MPTPIAIIATTKHENASGKFPRLAGLRVDRIDACPTGPIDIGTFSLKDALKV